MIYNRWNVIIWNCKWKLDNAGTLRETISDNGSYHSHSKKKPVNFASIF